MRTASNQHPDGDVRSGVRIVIKMARGECPMNVQANAVDETAILIEKDVDVPMRDGARLKADVFRPKDGKACTGAAQSRPVPKGQALDSA